MEKDSKDLFNSTIFLIVKFKGYLVRKLARNLISIAIPCLLFSAIHELTEFNFASSFSLPGLLGAALGVLLVFRTNTAYDRWWEARKVLGSMVNICRHFALHIHMQIEESENKKRLFLMLKAFPFVLKEHLRKGVIFEELTFLPDDILEQLKQWQHRPNGLVRMMLQVIEHEYERGNLSDFQRIKFMEYTDNLLVVLGKCERIHNTPIPIAHAYLLKIYIWIYAMIMPIGFIDQLGWWTFVPVLIIYYVAMSLVIIAEEIEDPFGHDPNDLPTDKMAHMIKGNIEEIQYKQPDYQVVV
ncbi:bestrophin family ion channel [Limibacter armeniacum]|uniref:bestrophin family protein n=1 Tax=Limibacter armeniacum TaxID=466084 RepID=UPI002FE64453